METQNETTTTAERAEPVETVGDIMSEARRASIKKIVLFISALVYVGGVLYAEVHGWNVLSNGVPPDLQIWAALGMVAAGLTALALPLAHLTWTFESLQRYFALGFYVLDFAFLALNAITDFNVGTGQQLAPWAVTYMRYVLPASPLLVAAGWAVLWELDPSTRAHVLRQTLRAAILQAKANQITTAAKAENVNQAVQDAAEREVSDALAELFGKPVLIERRQTIQNEQAAQAVDLQEEDQPATGGPFPGSESE